MSREITSFGPMLVAALLVAVALLVVLAFTAQRILETVLLWGLFVVPLTAAVPALHPQSQNYTAYYALALSVFTGITLLRMTRPPKVDVGVLFFALLIANWAVFALSTPGARNYYPLVMPLTGFALYLLILNRPLTETGSIIIRGVVTLTVVEAVIGLAQSLTGHPVFSGVLPTLYSSNRGYLGYLIPGFSTLVTQGSGTFEHFNGLGALLTLGVCVAFGSWLVHRPSWWRLRAFCVIAAGVVTTYSRGSLLGSAFGCLVILWLSERRVSRRTLVAALCIVGVLALASSALFIHYAGQTQNLTSRLTTWSDGLTYVSHHPSDLVLGTGYSSFAQVILVTKAGQPTTLAASTGQLTALHSGPLQVLLELGLAGFALYLGTLVVPIAGATRAPRNAMNVTLVGATLGVLLTQVFDNSTFGYTGVLMFASLALLRRNLQEDRATSPALASNYLRGSGGIHVPNLPERT